MNLWQDISPLFDVKFGNLESLEVRDDVLYIKINSDSQSTVVIFREFLSHRFIFESCALNILGGHDLNGKSWIFKSDKDEFCDWFNKQNYGIYSDNLHIYRLIFLHHIIDVLSPTPPEFYNIAL